MTLTQGADPYFSSIDHGEHLDFDQLLRLAEFKDSDVGRRRLMIEGREIGSDDRARSPDVAHTRARSEDEVVNHVLE